ncbi:MAG: VCBS repeat-containing protein, partial [Methylovulum sp.]|nr:VCBS repeat-containing protein [Methylovulum sp.]
MTTPTITLTATQSASEGGTNGIFTINLDAPAPTGGLRVGFNTTGSSAANSDYTLIAGSNISALTANSFVLAAGATTAQLQVQANADGQLEAAETLMLTLSVGNSGAVSFAAQQTFAVGDSPRSVSVGDVNGDGRLDVLTAN